MKDSIAWSMVAVPSPKWASKVFPDLAAEDQVPALWEAILKLFVLVKAVLLKMA